MDAFTADDTWDRLGRVAQLLHRAATQVWADADADAAAADSPLHDLGLGLYLAHSRASALLPDDYQLSEAVALLADIGEPTPLQLLTRAEELTRPLPLRPPDLVHASQLVVDLCGLIREARSLGY